MKTDLPSTALSDYPGWKTPYPWLVDGLSREMLFEFHLSLYDGALAERRHLYDNLNLDSWQRERERLRRLFREMFGPFPEKCDLAPRNDEVFRPRRLPRRERHLRKRSRAADNRQSLPPRSPRRTGAGDRPRLRPLRNRQGVFRISVGGHRHGSPRHGGVVLRSVRPGRAPDVGPGPQSHAHLPRARRPRPRRRTGGDELVGPVHLGLRAQHRLSHLPARGRRGQDRAHRVFGRRNADDVRGDRGGSHRRRGADLLRHQRARAPALARAGRQRAVPVQPAQARSRVCRFPGHAGAETGSHRRGKGRLLPPQGGARHGGGPEGDLRPDWRRREGRFVRGPREARPE